MLKASAVGDKLSSTRPRVRSYLSTVLKWNLEVFLSIHENGQQADVHYRKVSDSLFVTRALNDDSGH